MNETEPGSGPQTRVDLAHEAEFALGTLQVRPALREVVIAGEAQVLQPRVMQVLVALARRPGEVVSRDDLVASCWEGLSVSEDAINRCIAALRRVTGETRDAAFTIETVPRVGYRLTVLANERAALSQPRDSSGGPVTMAVLPFADMSPEQDQEYFSDGLSEELMNQLAQLAGLRVTARTSSFVFKGRNEDLRTIGEKLGVTHVLEGSVRKADKRLRITAQLVKCADGYRLWSHTYDRVLDDVFAIQENIAIAVTEALSVTLGVGKAAHAESDTTTGLETYDKYLRARAQLNNVSGSGDYVRAADMFHEVLALDPAYAPARGDLAATYACTLIFLPETSAQTLKEMDETVRQALARAPDHWASHLANGVLLTQRHDWLKAEAAFAKARALAPSSESSVGHFSGLFFGSLGRNDEAVRVLEAARSADPLSLVVSVTLQQNLDMAGRPGDAQAEYERTKDLPGGREIHEHQALMRIWDCGDAAAIKAQSRRFFDSQSVPMPVLNEVYEVFDRPQAALDLIRGAVADPAYQDATRMFILGWYAAHFGDQDLALAAMRCSLVDMKCYGPHMIWYPVMREARKTSAFKQLVRDLGIYDYWRQSGKWGDFARPLGDDDFEIIR